MKVINFYGGAGCGKSTTAAGLFFLMKINGYSVELVQEYVKDLAWEDRHEDQAFITANQNKKLHRLIGKVDYAICDSSLLLGLTYMADDYAVPSFRDYVIDLYNSYDNVLNIFVERQKPYLQDGRYETEANAIENDARIKQMLRGLKIPYHVVKGNVDAPDEVLKLVEYQSDTEVFFNNLTEAIP